MKAVLENTTVAKLQDGTAESLCVSYQGLGLYSVSCLSWIS